MCTTRCAAVLLAALAGACHSAAGPASPSGRPLPAQQVLADLQVLQRIKEAADAGLYKYHSKAQLDSAFAAARARVTGPLTVVEAYRLGTAGRLRRLPTQRHQLA